MRRDMTLVKKILKYVEDNIPSPRNFIANPECPGFTEEQVDYHVALCAKTGLLERNNAGMILDLTWSGHDELARLRECPPS